MFGHFFICLMFTFYRIYGNYTGKRTPIINSNDTPTTLAPVARSNGAPPTSSAPSSYVNNAQQSLPYKKRRTSVQPQSMSLNNDVPDASHLRRQQDSRRQKAYCRKKKSILSTETQLSHSARVCIGGGSSTPPLSTSVPSASTSRPPTTAQQPAAVQPDTATNGCVQCTQLQNR